MRLLAAGCDWGLGDDAHNEENKVSELSQSHI